MEIKTYRKKKNFKFWFLIVIIALLYLFAFGCLIYPLVMQSILSYQKFGVVINENIFIPHKSAWWLLGTLSCIPAYFLTSLLDNF